jgi:hypothetical protein
MDATSNVSLSVGPGAEGAWAAPEPVNRAIDMPRCSIRMLQEHRKAGFVSILGGRHHRVNDQHIDQAARPVKPQPELLAQCGGE